MADGHGRQHAFFEVFIAWAKANDIKFTCELWETYTVGPEVGDESKYRTEFVLRLGLARV